MNNRHILPAKQVAQFRPIVNVHKRTCTTPVRLSMNQLINSASIDSFLAASGIDGEQKEVNSPTDETEMVSGKVGWEKFNMKKEDLKRITKHSPIEEICVGDEMDKDSDSRREAYDQDNVSTVDLSKSLPNRNKKKVSRKLGRVFYTIIKKDYVLQKIRQNFWKNGLKKEFFPTINYFYK